MDWIRTGKQIRKYRLQKGWTQEKLAEAIEMTAKHIGNLENAKTQMSMECCVAIADALDVTPDALLIDSLEEDAQKEVLDRELLRQYRSCSIDERKKFLKYLQLFLDLERGRE